MVHLLGTRTPPIPISAYGPVYCVEDDHTTIVYLYLTCVGAKNTVQSLKTFERHWLVL